MQLLFLHPCMVRLSVGIPVVGSAVVFDCRCMARPEHRISYRAGLLDCRQQLSRPHSCERAGSLLRRSVLCCNWHMACGVAGL